MITTQFKKLIAGAVIILVLVGIVLFIRGSKNPTAPKPPNPRAEKIKGSQDAPVTILEFSDFQCPSCAFAETTVQKLLEKFPDTVQFHAYHFPLAMHRYGMDSSLAAECAAEQKKFWLYHDVLFHQQAVWSADPDARTLFLAYAKDLGLNQETFKSCFINPETQKKVEADKQVGEKLQVSSTPTFFIGEERLVGAKQLEEQGPAMIKKKLEALVQKK